MMLLDRPTLSKSDWLMRAKGVTYRKIAEVLNATVRNILL